ncbi:hypothetical protein EIN_334360 [Entamoeba invadens IP1]|uniref:Uncharacterized protein n=1 Tax=Entamoeba invadens IP1 TaxID=370355 RepID=A0A0A1UBE3_ENTIV|nr:hypothetical protein EIN_334360 [Entamoeba invadens IP1]ELP92439.1 hypothetical protein EIN_334360 [Entamoeba invadens IP1]|eukprot:XP_004259210.1 hypothetical protein EIN_334360 [Entamoeba invadens IP1]
MGNTLTKSPPSCSCQKCIDGPPDQREGGIIIYGPPSYYTNELFNFITGNITEETNEPMDDYERYYYMSSMSQTITEVYKTLTLTIQIEIVEDIEDLHRTLCNINCSFVIFEIDLNDRTTLTSISDALFKLKEMKKSDDVCSLEYSYNLPKDYFIIGTHGNAESTTNSVTRADLTHLKEESGVWGYTEFAPRSENIFLQRNVIHNILERAKDVIVLYGRVGWKVMKPVILLYDSTPVKEVTTRVQLTLKMGWTLV